MGPPPGSCTNEYPAYVTNATIVAGNQTYFPLKNNVYFQMMSNQTFLLTINVRVANQSSQGNTQSGQIWIGSNVIGFPESGCSGAGANQNITFNENVGFPATYSPSVNTNKTYYWAASNSFGFDVYWKAANPQPTVSHLQAASGNQTVFLSWTPSSSNGGYPVTNYQIWRGPASYYESFLAKVGNVTSYTDSNLTNDQTYYYFVVAQNTAGQISYESNQVSVVPAAPVAPSAPQDPLATAGSSRISLG